MQKSKMDLDNLCFSEHIRFILYLL